MFSACLGGYSGIEMNNSIENVNNRVNDFLDRYSMAEVPGIQYIVVKENQSVFSYYGGLADIKNKKPMTAKTTMHGYSMTKTFTAIAILQLAERGLLNLNDKVISVLPSIPYGNQITIRQLMSHTSGIPNPIPLRWAHLVERHRDFDESLALKCVLKEHSKVSFEPGEKYAYSNIGYWLLGRIVENITQITFSDYVRANIIRPLLLQPSEMDMEIHDLSNHAKGYLAKYSLMNLLKGFVTNDEVWGDYENNWLNIKYHYLNGTSVGGLLGSSYAFSRFLQDQLKENSVLLNKESMSRLYTQEKNNNGQSIDMTLGWHVGDFHGTKYFFKEGGGAGYHSEMRIYPDKGIGTVVMVNRTMFDSKKFLTYVDKEFMK